jgi:hypothetical protein
VFERCKSTKRERYGRHKRDLALHVPEQRTLAHDRSCNARVNLGATRRLRSVFRTRCPQVRLSTLSLLKVGMYRDILKAWNAAHD